MFNDSLTASQNLAEPLNHLPSFTPLRQIKKSRMESGKKINSVQKKILT